MHSSGAVVWEGGGVLKATIGIKFAEHFDSDELCENLVTFGKEMKLPQHTLVEWQSTQMLFFFGTTTMPAHHGVSWSNFEMTPNVSMRESSSATFVLNGRGM